MINTRVLVFIGILFYILAMSECNYDYEPPKPTLHFDQKGNRL